jgi:NAD+ diphosphatase
MRTAAYLFIFRNTLLAMRTTDGGMQLPGMEDLSLVSSAILYSRDIGILADKNCLAVELTETAASPDWQFITLREAFAHLDRNLWTMAGRALQIVQWQRNHRFCSRCGTGMIEQSPEYAKKCPQCTFISYPRLSPAVIMTLIDGNRILLGRSHHFPAGMYSPLAGFVEPGEDLEEAVHREVKEEVNLNIRNIRYVCSQPWPFPHSLMIGFTARFAGGKLQINHQELEDAAWFTADQMPILPSRMSIARSLIELFLQQQPDPDE